MGDTYIIIGHEELLGEVAGIAARVTCAVKATSPSLTAITLFRARDFSASAVGSSASRRPSPVNQQASGTTYQSLRQGFLWRWEPQKPQSSSLWGLRLGSQEPGGAANE